MSLRTSGLLPTDRTVGGVDFVSWPTPEANGPG
jgi:hypothetical protein